MACETRRVGGREAVREGGREAVRDGAREWGLGREGRCVYNSAVHSVHAAPLLFKVSCRHGGLGVEEDGWMGAIVQWREVSLESETIII